jgi:hypothetical protein
MINSAMQNALDKMKGPIIRQYLTKFLELNLSWQANSSSARRDTAFYGAQMFNSVKYYIFSVQLY